VGTPFEFHLAPALADDFVKSGQNGRKKKVSDVFPSRGGQINLDQLQELSVRKYCDSDDRQVVKKLQNWIQMND
jgi:hypothetical protein